MISLIHFPNPRAVDSTTTPIHDTDTHTHTQTQSHTESSHEHIRRCWRLWMLDAGSHRNTIITIKKSIVIMMIIIVGCDGKINRFMRAHNRKTKWKKHFGGGFCFFFFFSIIAILHGPWLSCMTYGNSEQARIAQKCFQLQLVEHKSRNRIKMIFVLFIYIL